jgi:hypothetical protein
MLFCLLTTLVYWYVYKLVLNNPPFYSVDEDVAGLTDVQIHDRDMEWLTQCDGNICRIFSHIVCLFVLSHTLQFFSYLAAVTITGDRAANLDLCLALTAFSR